MHRPAALLYAVLALAGASSASTPRNAAPGVKYVGSKVCAGCHAEIYSKYVRTAMGRSMSVATPDASPSSATIHSDALNRDFRVYSDGGNLYQSESETRDGKLIFEAAHKVAYSIGSGENGVSFAVERGSYLFQAPLSFFSRTGKWDLSPGFAQSDLGFNRPIYEACITCHAGRPQPVPDRDGLFRHPAFLELAIGCENCHGPGELHVADRAIGAAHVPDDSIVNPSRLPARLAEDICMKCHQGGDVRALLPGKRYADFRPGLPLIATVAVVALPLSTANTDLLEHHVSMKLSRCYRESGGKLSCLTCHDPHVEPAAAAAPAYFRSRCFTCHTDASCRLPAKARAQTGDNCIACHMPKRDVRQIAHAALTNHRIPVNSHARPADLSLPDSVNPNLADLLLLDAADGQPLPIVTRLAIYGELSGRSAALLTRYLALLDEAAKVQPDDPLVLAALGRRSLMDKQADALTLLSRASSVEIPGALTLVDYSQALDLAGAATQALQVLERAATLFPYSKEIRKRLLLHYIQLHRYTDAREAMTHYVADFPEDDFIRGLLDRVSQGG